MHDSEVNAAVEGVIERAPRRRLAFVPAQYSYKQDFGDRFTFERVNDYCEIVRGYSSKYHNQSRRFLFEPRKLAAIKNWSGGFFPMSAMQDGKRRGFATSVLFCLSSCPVFRNFAPLHRATCHAVGCTLCKLYRFFEESEANEGPKFPLELRVFDRSYKEGDKGDSAAFFSSFMDVLQQEELAGSRSFGETDQYTTAIGQMFRVKAINRFFCEKCGYAKNIEDSFWTIVAADLEKELNESYEEQLTCKCEACDGKMRFSQRFDSLPLVISIQIPHWNNSGHYKKRAKQLKKSITVGEKKYKLVAFTVYDGYSTDDGKFSAVFLSSSGTWYHHSSGIIQIVSAKKIDDFMPQLAFYSIDEPNEVEQRAIITRIVSESDDENKEEEEKGETKIEQEIDTKRAEVVINNLRESISKNMQNSSKMQKMGETQQKQKAVIVKNPLEMLLQSSTRNTKTWNGEVSANNEEKFTEVGLDDWDAELDKGHQRKIKKRREIPDTNPFENFKKQKNNKNKRKNKPMK